MISCPIQVYDCINRFRLHYVQILAEPVFTKKWTENSISKVLQTKLKLLAIKINDHEVPILLNIYSARNAATEMTLPALTIFHLWYECRTTVTASRGLIFEQ